MARKLLISLDDTQEKRLLDLVHSYRSSGFRVSFSDVLRQGLNCLFVQEQFPFASSGRADSIKSLGARLAVSEYNQEMGFAVASVSLFGPPISKNAPVSSPIPQAVPAPDVTVAKIPDPSHPMSTFPH